MVFGIPNPLTLFTDWTSGATAEVWDKMIDQVIDRPLLLLIPLAIVIGALIPTSYVTAYSIAHAVASGTKDGIEDKPFGFVLLGNLLDADPKPTYKLDR